MSVGCAPRGDSAVPSSAPQPPCSGSRVALVASAVPSSGRLHVPGAAPWKFPARLRRLPHEEPAAPRSLRWEGRGVFVLEQLSCTGSRLCWGSCVPSRGCVHSFGCVGGFGLWRCPNPAPFPARSQLRWGFPSICAPWCSRQVQECWARSGHCQGHLGPLQSLIPQSPWRHRLGWAGCREGMGQDGQDPPACSTVGLGAAGGAGSQHRAEEGPWSRESDIFGD